VNSTRFPNPRLYGDIIAIGGTLNPDLLFDAYSHGIFPWPMGENEEIPWFCPEKRAVLFFDEMRINRTLLRQKRRSPFTYTIDQAFEEVIENCADTPRPGQEGTWITEEVIRAYTEFHRLGHAHSVEVWEESLGEKNLIGGIYGVEIQGVFSAESMFFKKSYASKLALLYLIDHLKKQGAQWLDIQVMTPHMEALGAREINRDEFLQLLASTQLLRQQSSSKIF
jgi:leucyl/phenylalanyl-tRNA--protein transferase